jgi:hypothetical protein
MNKAIWYGRDGPKVRDHLTAKELGYEIMVPSDWLELAMMDLNNVEQVRAALTRLFNTARAHGAAAIFGEMPGMIVAQAARTAQDAVHRGEWAPGDVPFYIWVRFEAEHKGRWMLGGMLGASSIRWLSDGGQP